VLAYNFDARRLRYIRGNGGRLVPLHSGKGVPEQRLRGVDAITPGLIVPENTSIKTEMLTAWLAPW
jgi:hypothetical protein